MKADPEQLLTRAGAARRLQISLRALDAVPRDLLPRVELGERTIRYDPADLAAYVAAKKKAA